MTPIRFHREDIPSSPITTSEGADAVLLGACEAIETAVEKGLEGSSVDQSSEIDDNKAFLQENLKSEDENKSDQKNWLDEDLDNTNNELEEAAVRCIPQEATNASSNYTKEKLVQILGEEQFIPKQCWGFTKILTTLVYHQKDKRLCIAYC